jgi:glycosyltransferase involved in cell wall biosynthesis
MSSASVVISPWDREISASLIQRGREVHVLFLIDQLCGRGGAESALLNTVRSLPARFRCSVITFKLNPNLTMLAEFPFPVRVLPLRCSYDWNAMKMAVRLTRYIHAEQVDIVHTFFPSSDLWGGVVAKLARRRPLLVSSRRDMGFLRTTKHRIAYRALRGMFDQVLTVSEKVRQYSIAEDGLDPDRVRVIPNSVAPQQLEVRDSVATLRQRFGLARASHVITSVGNVRRIKGTDVLVRAAALVCRQFPRAVFVVAGALETCEPGYLRELERLKRDHHVVRNVRLVGPFVDVAPLLKASDIFCLLSRSEGFSNALIEAMACGLPCVATDVGGNPEALLDGRCGFLVESEDYKTAADRILSLLRDPEMARGVAESGLQSVRRRFLPEIVTPQLVEVYESLLSTRKQPGGSKG